MFDNLCIQHFSSLSLSAFRKFTADFLNDIVFITNCSNNSNGERKIVNCYPGVVNLSDKSLAEAEMSLLSKSLTFVDTSDMGIIAEDIRKFHLSAKQHLCLGKRFTPSITDNSQDTTVLGSIPVTAFNHSKLRNPSKWNPPGPMLVEHLCHCLTRIMS